MGFIDKIKNGLPFSWGGDYSAIYNEQTIQTETRNAPEQTQEPEIFRKHRIALQKYSEKLKDREKLIEQSEQDSIARIQSARNDLKNFSKALYETEYRIMDYAKRIDSKEISFFEEIKESADKFSRYNSNPSQNGFEFENDFSKLLVQNGFINVFVTQRSKDFGADITAEKDGISYVIQCKYYSSAVGIEAVQQVYGAKIHYGTHLAVVATNSVFTHAAKTLAKETGVLLWDCEKIEQMKNNSK